MRASQSGTAPFGPLDRADLHQLGRLHIYETADAVIIHIPVQPSWMRNIGLGLFGVFALFFTVIIISLATALVFVETQSALQGFAALWLIGACAGLAASAYQVFWNAMGDEWVRVTSDKIEMSRPRWGQHRITAYSAAGTKDLQTCPPLGYRAQRKRRRYQALRSCPARFKAVQFKHGSVWRGFGQGLSDQQAWAIYEAIVGRFPGYRSYDRPNDTPGPSAVGREHQHNDPRRPFHH